MKLVGCWHGSQYHQYKNHTTGQLPRVNPSNGTKTNNRLCSLNGRHCRITYAAQAGKRQGSYRQPITETPADSLQSKVVFLVTRLCTPLAPSNGRYITPDNFSSHLSELPSPLQQGPISKSSSSAPEKTLAAALRRRAAEGLGDRDMAKIIQALTEAGIAVDQADVRLDPSSALPMRLALCCMRLVPRLTANPGSRKPGQLGVLQFMRILDAELGKCPKLPVLPPQRPFGKLYKLAIQPALQSALWDSLDGDQMRSILHLLKLGGLRPEVWSDSFIGPGYRVSSEGRVWSTFQGGRLLPGSLNKGAKPKSVKLTLDIGTTYEVPVAKLLVASFEKRQHTGSLVTTYLDGDTLNIALSNLLLVRKDDLSAVSWPAVGSNLAVVYQPESMAARAISYTSVTAAAAALGIPYSTAKLHLSTGQLIRGGKLTYQVAPKSQVGELWMPIPGAYAQVSNEGRVWSAVGGNILTPSEANGYLVVNLKVTGTKAKNYFLHRLVAKQFCANPSNLPQVNHIDGDKRNNRAVNLQWVPAKENGQAGQKMKRRVTKRPVWQCCPKCHQPVKWYPSMSQASRESSSRRDDISRVARGVGKIAGGWGWMLADYVDGKSLARS